MRSIRYVVPILAVIFAVAPFTVSARPPGSGAVQVYEGEVEIPSYEFSGRELEPALFGNSSIEGEYPLPPFIRPYKPGGPFPIRYKAVFVENEYMRITVIPDFGGRIYSLYDKVNAREVFYKNDVLKFSGVNPKRAWPVGDIEITGPHDHHMLTVKGEPYWFTRVVRGDNGSASIVLSSIDPYYRMKLSFIATLHPGLAAMELEVFLYNRRDVRQPYMLWVNAGVPARPGTRFIYPMGRTIGHTTSEVADWPFYGGIDYSWFKNNQHMLGVFGIDIYDNFLGAYDYDLDYGTFRWADRRVAQGMKTWTWGMSRRAETIEQGYTDNAGPYIEIQSGRNVWDGHYEWLRPHGHEGWTEWWFPVAGTGGLTTTNRLMALNLDLKADPKGRNSTVAVGLSANREFRNARIIVTARNGASTLLDMSADLAPGKPFFREMKRIAADSARLSGMRVRVIDSGGKEILDYLRPDHDPSHREYTPFTRQLERPRKRPTEMSAEELVLEAETRIKEMHTTSGTEMLRTALELDPGHSRAHLHLGIRHFEDGRIDSAIIHLESAVDRDPYLEQAFYYLAMSHLEFGDTVRAERNLYYIPRTGELYSPREYMLGRLALLRGEFDPAREHLREAVRASGYNLSARVLLALVHRLEGDNDKAAEQLSSVLEIDPTNRWAEAERMFLCGEEKDREALAGLLGGQSQESVELAGDYIALERWEDALAILGITGYGNADPYGTPAIYHYTVARCLKNLGRMDEATRSYRLGARSGGNIDRFPFRHESIRALSEAVVFDPADMTARFQLGALLYHLGLRDAAIAQWSSALERNQDHFSTRRALGLALAENGHGIDRAAEHLDAAIELDPTHVRTFADLSLLYSKEGAFDRQLVLLQRALERSPDDDNLIEGLLTTHLIAGNYDTADSIILNHVFEQRHRDYGLRDKYRFLRYAIGNRAFARGDFMAAKAEFEKALFPPGSLGADDFQFQSAPRAHYYIGLALEKAGRSREARAEFEKSSAGWKYLSGDRDSNNSENVYMALALEKLDQLEDAERLLESMASFARGQIESRYRSYRAEAHYLLALTLKRKGEYEEARELMKKSLEIEPTMLGPRLELRGDVVDPIPGTGRGASD